MDKVFASSHEKEFQQLVQIIEKYQSQPGALMPVLQEAQGLFGFLPIEVQNFISEQMRIPLPEVYGVVTFYSQFNLEEQGQYTIGVCMGTACYVRGAKEIVDIIKKKLDVDVGATTEDRKFSLVATRCIGACGLAPVLTINEDVYGRLKIEDVPGILEKY